MALKTSRGGARRDLVDPGVEPGSSGCGGRARSRSRGTSEPKCGQSREDPGEMGAERRLGPGGQETEGPKPESSTQIQGRSWGSKSRGRSGSPGNHKSQPFMMLFRGVRKNVQGWFILFGIAAGDAWIL